MSDLDDLYGVPGIRDRSLRWNALTGDGWRLESYDPTADEKGFTLLEADTEWTVDMLSRRRGVGKTGDGTFDMRLTAVGSKPPSIPDDPTFKPAVSMTVWSAVHGIAEVTTCSAVLRNAIVAFWDFYKSYQEASRGLLPVVRFGPGREVTVGKNTVRSFWAPTFEIMAWASRKDVPGIQYRPATVAPPMPQNLQIPHLSARLQAHLGNPAASQVLDDSIPF